MPRATLLLLICLAVPGWAGEVRLAVASNFRGTAELINNHFEQSTGHRAVISSASTGTLHSQIQAGAPFDLLLAADSESPKQLQRAGIGPRFCYALGQLALVGGDGSLSLLADPAASLAIANPRTAPYGRAAQQVLAQPKLGRQSGGKLVRANNVAQAYQLWYTGAVDLALVARAQAPEEGLAIPAHWHSPLEQQALLLRQGQNNPAALAYVDFLQSEAGRSLIQASGYAPCP